MESHSNHHGNRLFQQPARAGSASRARRQTGRLRYAAPAIAGTLTISAAMNGFAFAAHEDGLLIYPAIGLGLAIPALIYALTKVAATLWIEA